MALAQNNATVKSPRGHAGYQFTYFIFFATIGMGVIGASLLAKPLTVYFADKQGMIKQQQRQEKLQELHRQQQALLENADNPMVVERVAVNHLHYRSAAVAAGQPAPSLPELPKSFELLIRQAEQDEAAVRPGLVQRWAEALAQRPREQMILLALGAGLTVVSMTCFYRQRV